MNIQLLENLKDVLDTRGKKITLNNIGLEDAVSFNNGLEFDKELANKITVGIKNEIEYFRTQFLPVVKELYNKVKTKTEIFINKHKVLPFRIKEVSLPYFMHDMNEDGTFNIFGRFNKELEIKNSTIIPEFSFDEFNSYIKGFYSEDIIEYLNTISKEKRENVYNLILSNPSNYRTVYVEKEIADENIILAFIYLYTFYKNGLERCNISPVGVTAFIKHIGNELSYLSTLISGYLDVLNNVKEHNIIILDKSDETLYVPKGYGRILKENNLEIDALFGTFLLENSKNTYSINELVDVKDNLIKLISDYRNSREIKAKYTLILELRDIFKLEISEFINEQDIVYGKNHGFNNNKEIADEFISKINKLSDRDFDNLREVLIKLFIDVLYKNTNFKFIYDRLKYYNKDLDPKTSALYIAGELAIELIVKDISVTSVA